MRRTLAIAVFVAFLASVLVAPSAGGAAPPPLGISSNVSYLGNVPGAAIGMHFKGHYAYVTGPAGITVLDIVQPADPRVVGALPLPHFENEDVDLCGNTLLVSNDREAKDVGSILYVIDITVRTQPTVLATLPLGLTGVRDAAQGTSRTS